MTDPRGAGGAGRGADDWRSRAERLQIVREQARGMRREPADRRHLAGLAVATAAWAVVVIWMVADLPDRVPQHLLSMTFDDVATLRAAHRPGGVRSPAELWIGGSLFLVAVAVWLIRRARSDRYSPHDDLD
ncbi:hypothetical protein [Mobilicoccus pelagius]|uniref:DUF1648 domain-containing protein n=1 Tax=Mobilicoccus pelagius NBRC 104925 TaxID=1089455 RepID=H5UP53_9MICO|nr:hypothetical protein [Mobilicoccus pelagius]GAB47511.1 hypothetical protein MOPEL_018_00020 [Mobilicoccus pelagius NBRC 104925]